MGRKRWRERRGNPLRDSFDMVPVGELASAAGFTLNPSQRAVAARILCGADLGDGLTCRRMAGHERVGPDCSSQTLVDLGSRGFGRTARRRALLAELMPEQTEDDRVIAEGIDQVIHADLVKAYDYEPEIRQAHCDDPQRCVSCLGLAGLPGDQDREDPFGPGRVENLPRPTAEQLAALDELPPVSNPAPGLWEIVTGKPLPSYAELLERGRRRAEHPTYDLLNVQSNRTPELSATEAYDRLTAAIGRPHLCDRVMTVLPPALASQLALAVDEAVRRGIAEHVATERAVLAGMAEGAQARLAQSIEDQKRGREAHAERWTTPSRLS